MQYYIRCIEDTSMWECGYILPLKKYMRGRKIIETKKTKRVRVQEFKSYEEAQNWLNEQREEILC